MIYELVQSKSSAKLEKVLKVALLFISGQMTAKTLLFTHSDPSEINVRFSLVWVLNFREAALNVYLFLFFLTN